MADKIILYHDRCQDGFCAAFFIHQKFPDAQLCPVLHDEPAPNIEGKDVIIADFAYNKKIMLDIKSKAKSLILLDHHKTAIDELSVVPELKENCVFDLNRSGAGIAYDYFYAGEERHWLVDYIEDRDLWRWRLNNSREINLAIMSYPRNLDTWYDLMDMNVDDLAEQGRHILRYQQQLVADACAHAQKINFGGYEVLAVNTINCQSEVAGYLAKSNDFGVSYYENKNGDKIVSLRSKGDKIDVSAIAKKYGGGGHFNSAGCKIKKGSSW